MASLIKAVQSELSLMAKLEASASKRQAKMQAAAEKAVQVINEEPKEVKITPAQRKRQEAIQALRNSSVEIPPWLRLVDNLLALDAMVKDLEQNEIITLDVETNSLDWTRAKLVAAVYYSPASGLGYFVPIAMNDPKYHNISLETYQGAVKGIHLNPAIKKVNHNIRYDAHILREHGVALGGIYYDTLIAMKVLDETLDTYALKELVRQFLGYEDAYRFDQLFDGGGFADAPYPVAHLYAGKDGKLAYELYLFQMKYLTQPQYQGLHHILFDIELPLIDIVIEMEESGFRINHAYIESETVKVRAILKRLNQELTTTIAAPAIDYFGRLLRQKREAIRQLMKGRGFDVEEPANEQEAIALSMDMEQIGGIAYGPLGHERPRSRRVTKSGLKKLEDPIVDAMMDYLDTQAMAYEISTTGKWEMNFGSPMQVGTLLFDVLGLPEIDERGTGEDILKTLSKEVKEESALRVWIEDKQAHRLMSLDVPDLGKGALVADKLEAAKRFAFAQEKDGKPMYYAYGWRGGIAARLLEFREMEKTLTAFLETIPVVLGADGRMHTSLNQFGTKTGRFTSSGVGKKKGEKMGLNLQQMPNNLAKVNIRSAFLPFLDGEWLLCGIDYSQIEPRLAAHQSQAKEWLEAYQNGKDVYIRTAAAVHGKPEDEVTTKERKDVKAVALGLMYGLTKFGLSDQLGTTPDEAEEFKNLFLEAIPEIKADIDKAHAECRENGFVEDWAGRKRRLPEIWTPQVRREYSWGVKYVQAPEVARAERQSYNHKIQAGAQEIIKMAMANVWKLRKERGYRFFFCNQIHDEVLFCIPKDWAEYVELDEKHPKTGEPIKVWKWVPRADSPILEVAETMRTAVTLSVPLKVDIAIGENWGQLD